jgi:branched-chain amino acid transport system permease protein
VRWQAKPWRRRGAARTRCARGGVAAGLFGIAALLAGCAPALETDQARLCRMALPAMEGADAIDIVSQSEDADDRGVVVEFRANLPDGEAGTRAGTAQTHVARCRFREPGRPLHSSDLVAMSIDGETLGEAQLFMLIRYWLATPEGRNADPAPLGDLRGVPQLPHALAYGLQMALDGLPLSAIYALLATAYSLIYGLIGRVNFAFGELAAAGGYAAAMVAVAIVAVAPTPILLAALAAAAFAGSIWGYAAARWVFAPLRRSRGQQVLVATVGLALFAQELLRLAQGDRSSWMSPLYNQPFALARSGDFLVAATPILFIASAIGLGVALMLIVVFRWTRFGREWRAYADDPFAAELFGVNPDWVLARSFLLAGALAGLAGATMTATYGAVGYGLAAKLSLKALAAAILGGIGSIPGAFFGALLIGGFEAAWSALFSIDYRDVAIYCVLAALIALRPQGLLGAREAGASDPARRGP